MLIDPQGLLYGERIGACSDEAQLHFPRLLTASNRFGRIELGYPDLMKSVYSALRVKPTQEQLRTMLLEYRSNHLLFIYKGPDGKTYGQWEIPEKFLTKHKRSEDFLIPEPPLTALQAFRNTYIEAKRAQSVLVGELFDTLEVSETFLKTSEDFQTLQKSSEEFQNLSNISRKSSTVQLGVGVGVGVGEGKDSCGAPSAPPAVIGLSTVSGELHLVTAPELERLTESYPAVDVMQQLRQMREWLLANPRNRKTSSGMARFIANWLAKEQNAARTPVVGPRVVGPVRSVPDAVETAQRLKNEYSERDVALRDWRDLRQRDEAAYEAEAPGWAKAVLAAEPAERVA